MHRRVTANLDRGEHPLPQCPCSLHWGTWHIIYLIIDFFSSKFSLQLLLSLVCHRDTRRPTGLITLSIYFLKCNIYSYPGTYTPLLLHIADFFLFLFFYFLYLTKMKCKKKWVHSLAASLTLVYLHYAPLHQWHGGLNMWAHEGRVWEIKSWGGGSRAERNSFGHHAVILSQKLQRGKEARGMLFPQFGPRCHLNLKQHLLTAPPQNPVAELWPSLLNLLLGHRRTVTVTVSCLLPASQLTLTCH